MPIASRSSKCTSTSSVCPYWTAGVAGLRLRSSQAAVLALRVVMSLLWQQARVGAQGPQAAQRHGAGQGEHVKVGHQLGLVDRLGGVRVQLEGERLRVGTGVQLAIVDSLGDRKSTRLNSSHITIS